MFDRATADRYMYDGGVDIRSIHTSLVLAIGTKSVRIICDEIIHRQRKCWLIMHWKVSKHSADLQINVPSSVYKLLFITRSLVAIDLCYKSQ